MRQGRRFLLSFPLTLLALTATLLTTLVPTSAHAQGPKREIIVWGAGLGPDSKGVEAVIREFERRNPDIRVRALSMGAGGMNPQKLMTAIVGKVPPDVIVQDRFSISDYASRDAFMSLDELIARDRDTDPLTPTPEKFYPFAWQEATYQGRVYGIPVGADNRILYWNRKLFREKADELRAAGLDPERPPRTWSEAKAYSKVLTTFDARGNLKTAGFLPNFGNAWLYLYAFQNNASFMSADRRTATMATPEAEEALQFMIDAYNIVGGYERARTFESGFGARELNGFYQGKVAFKVDGDWTLNDMSRYAPNLDFGVAPPPVPDDRYHRRGRFANEKDQFISWMGGFSVVIPRGARNVEDAWKYIKFMTSAEGRLVEARAQRDWERFRGRSFIPRMMANVEANEAQFREFPPADAKFKAALRQHIDLMPVARTRPPTFVGQMLWDAQVRAMDRACRGELSPMAALMEGQTTVQRELDAFFSREKFSVVSLEWPTYMFLGAIALAGAGFVWTFRRQRLGRLAKSEALWAYLFVSPWVIGFVLLTLGPMLTSLFFSFTRYNVLSDPRWVGTANYVEMFTVDRVNFLKAWGNALFLAGIGVPLGLMTGLAIALLLNAAVRGMNFFRTAFYLPAIVPGIAAAILWAFILNPDPGRGLLNNVWDSTFTPWLGIPTPGWLQSEHYSKNTLIMMGVWGAGSGMILWLAGLKGIPNTLYEASSIDGATPKQQFWSITVPQLSPIIFFNLIVGFIGALQEFDRVFVFSPGEGTVGPADSLLMPVYMLFRNGFSLFKMGYASSLAWVIFAVILLLTFIQFKLAPRWVHYEADK